MAGGFGNIVQKAFYLGVGVAAYAGEQASSRLKEVRIQGQKLADELVARGEIKAEEAQKFVDDLVQQAQKQETVSQEKPSSQPRQIEILEDDAETDSSKAGEDVDNLRQQVETLQEQLRNLKE